MKVQFMILRPNNLNLINKQSRNSTGHKMIKKASLRMLISTDLAIMIAMRVTEKENCRTTEQATSNSAKITQTMMALIILLEDGTII